MKANYYVIFNKSGIDRVVMTDRFTLKGGEYAQRVDLEVDDRLFQRVVIPRTLIQIGSDSVARTIEVDQT